MRGKGKDYGGQERMKRITPAYAGKSILATDWVFRCRDHPRICGEKSSKGTWPSVDMGSPPHMRGKALVVLRSPPVLRITPAYAGKSFTSSLADIFLRDHPRICGEKRVICLSIRPYTGSPPHMRGKVPLSKFGYDADRITPAYAGKSSNQT